jgi:hypothetical protein
VHHTLSVLLWHKSVQPLRHSFQWLSVLQ